MKRDGAVFGSFRYVVDRPHPAGSSCDRLSAAGAGRLDAASSQRGTWGGVWRHRHGEHLWCSDDPCAGKVHRLAGRGILCDHPHACHCVFTQGERTNPHSTRVAECRASPAALCAAASSLRQRQAPKQLCQRQAPKQLCQRRAPKQLCQRRAPRRRRPKETVGIDRTLILWIDLEGVWAARRDFRGRFDADFEVRQPDRAVSRREP